MMDEMVSRGSGSVKVNDIGFEEALSRTLDVLRPLPPVSLSVTEVCGLAAAEYCVADMDCPSVTSALKDGYAVRSADLEGATREFPVRLKRVGEAVAGRKSEAAVVPGGAVKITTGAELPEGADAVIAVEFACEEEGEVLCFRDAGPGRNVQKRGSDVAAGDRIAESGEVLRPARMGLLAAGGVHTLAVHPRPRVAIVAIGDEVVLPGRSLRPGQLYASNLVTLLGWMKHFRFEAESSAVGDDQKEMRVAIEKALADNDTLITSGGVWKSERDLTVKTIREMGGELVFHRVRMGPGKAMALMLVGGKPVFCLPGGPASNEMAFLQIALPGLLRLAGRSPRPFARRRARLLDGLKGEKDWTQFFQGDLGCDGGAWTVSSLKRKSRMRSQAEARAVISIPEGVHQLEAGADISVQVLFDGEDD